MIEIGYIRSWHVYLEMFIVVLGSIFLNFVDQELVLKLEVERRIC